MNIREWVLLLASGFIGLSFLVFVIQLLRYSSLYVKTTGTVRLVYQRKEDDVTQY